VRTLVAKTASMAPASPRNASSDLLTGAGSSTSRRKTDVRLTEHGVLGIVKRAAARAGLEAPVGPHWLHHAHASHAIDRGATLPEVQPTLGHGNIATTSEYLHARPESSSGPMLDPGVFLRRLQALLGPTC
jgi:integrase